MLILFPAIQLIGLQDNQEDPDPQKANTEAVSHSEENMAVDLLRKMPGITEQNYKYGFNLECSKLKFLQESHR